jgi:hypothetical protein
VCGASLRLSLCPRIPCLALCGGGGGGGGGPPSSLYSDSYGNLLKGAYKRN